MQHDKLDNEFRDSEWREVLGAAALINDVTVVAMAAAAGVTPEVAERVRSDAQAAKVIRGRALDPAVATELIDGLSPERYADIHAAASRFFAQGSTADKMQAIVLARRAGGAVPHEEKVTLIDEAAAAQLADGQFATAVELFAEADGLDPQRTSARRARRLVDWARAAEYLGDADAARNLRLRGFDLAEQLGDGHVMTAIAVAYATPPGWRFGDETAHRLVARAEAAATADTDVAQLTATRAMLSMRVPVDPATTTQLGWVTQPAVAQPMADAAVRRATDTDDATELLALLAWRTTHCGPSFLPQRREITHAAMELAQGAGDHDQLVQACMWAATDAIESADVAGLERAVAVARWAAERSGIPRALWYSHVLQASRALMAGDVDAALRHQSEARRVGLAASLPGTVPAELALGAQMLFDRDDPAEIDPAILGPDSPSLTGHLGRVCNAWAQARCGRHDGAARDLAVTLRWLDDESSLLMIGVMAARTAVMLNDADAMGRLVTRLGPWSHHVAVDASAWWCVGPVSLALAEMHHGLGNLDTARTLVAEAAFTAERLHDTRSLQRAQTLWAEIGASPGGPGVTSTRLEVLTDRERTVLALLAQGSTNPDIAAELAYSLATVRRDTISIYRKLGVGGRVEATAIAIAEGLVADSP